VLAVSVKPWTVVEPIVTVPKVNVTLVAEATAASPKKSKVLVTVINSFFLPDDVLETWHQY
jgi:hypothetical protein